LNKPKIINYNAKVSIMDVNVGVGNIPKKLANRSVGIGFTR
jgi:hypothetical protein